MKKLFFILLAIICLTGCTKTKRETTFMITRDDKLYALYNSKGDKLTDYLYKTFNEVENWGYLVTNDKNQVGFISLKGEEIIPFGAYEKLEVVDDMFVAIKKEEKDAKGDIPTNRFVQNNFFILNMKGEVLYSASKDVQIRYSGLPIIFQNKEYSVLYKDGQIISKGNIMPTYASSFDYGKYVVVGFKDKETFYFDNDKEEKESMDIKEKGNFKILAHSDKGALLSDPNTKQMLYVTLANKKYEVHSVLIKEADIDQMGMITLKNDNNTYMFVPGNDPILMTSFYFNDDTYAIRSSDVYGPHALYKNNKKTAEIENCQLYPIATHIYNEIFPVYLRDKGYVYYSFDGKQVLSSIYYSAEPFDLNSLAIVQTGKDEYSLINKDGNNVTSKTYSQIKFIGNSYYAIYDKNGLFGIIDSNGKEVLPMEYTYLPQNPIVNYNEEDYLLLSKNGRTYVYDIEDDMNVIFSKEGHVVFNEKGYFVEGYNYYTFEGDVIK